MKVRYHFHITGKYKVFAHIDRSINLRLNHNILVVFNKLKSYDSHFIIQQRGNFILKISVISNGFAKYMDFTINNKFSFIGNFQFLSSSLDSLVKNLNELFES